MDKEKIFGVIKSKEDILKILLEKGYTFDKDDNLYLTEDDLSFLNIQFDFCLSEIPFRTSIGDKYYVDTIYGMIWDKEWIEENTIKVYVLKEE